MSVPAGHDIRTCVCGQCVAVRKPKPGTTAAAYNELPEGAKFVAGIGAIIGAIVLLFVLGSALIGDGNDACDQYRNALAESITILQMADESLSFTHASILAEQMEGPSPSNC